VILEEIKSMKHKLFTLALVFASILTLSADEPDTLLFHVIAESGLVLRLAEGTDSEKLALIPYEDTLLVVGIYMLAHEGNKEVIDGKEGHWLPAIYEGKEGYVFTAFIRRGHKYIPDSGDLHYRMLFEYQVQTPLNYAPGLYWYGFYLDSSNMSLYIEEIDVEMELSIPDYNEEFPEYSNMKYYKPKTNKSRRSEFIIGMKKPMDSKERKSWLMGKPQSEEGKFLHVYESLELYGKGGTMYLKPIVKMVKDTSYDGKVTDLMSYALILSSSNYLRAWDEAQEFTFPNIIHETRSAELHTLYKNPQVFWKGDLNEDGNDDLIIRTSHMSEQCGGGVEFHILISKQEEQYFSLEKLGSGAIFHEGC